MTSSLELRFDLTGVGWAEATLSAGNDSVTILASYLSDALGDLAAATVLIASGLDEAR